MSSTATSQGQHVDDNGAVRLGFRVGLRGEGLHVHRSASVECTTLLDGVRWQRQHRWATDRTRCSQGTVTTGGPSKRKRRNHSFPVSKLTSVCVPLLEYRPLCFGECCIQSVEFEFIVGGR